HHQLSAWVIARKEDWVNHLGGALLEKLVFHVGELHRLSHLQHVARPHVVDVSAAIELKHYPCEGCNNGEPFTLGRDGTSKPSLFVHKRVEGLPDDDAPSDPTLLECLLFTLR